jgi:hypothetical protein
VRAEAFKIVILLPIFAIVLSLTVLTVTTVVFSELETTTENVDENLLPTDDAEVAQSYPDSNYGGLTYLYVGRWEGGAERAFLKFDLSEIPQGSTITEAKYYNYCWRVNAGGANVQVQAVENDAWAEGTITWNNQPALGPVLDGPYQVASPGQWYSWDIIDFVIEQFAGDKMVSICMVDTGENSGEQNSVFESKEWGGERPYLEVTYLPPPYAVSVSISPSVRGGMPGKTLTYTATVTNRGLLNDSYELTVDDTAGWEPALNDNLFENVPAGEERTTQLSVTIPDNAEIPTQDEITVTATSQENENAWNSGSCMVLCPVEPDYIYLTYASPDTAHTINVSWRVVENYIGGVLYDTESRGGIPDNYNYTKNGTGGVTTPKLEGYFHHAELTGLQPDTVYYFICGGENEGWSNEQSFRTAPDRRTNFRFAMGGDSRSGGEWPGPRDAVSDRMAQYDPSFVLFVGDFIMNGEEQPGEDTWDNWLGAIFKYWRTNDNMLIPLIPVIGNHEIGPYQPQPPDYDPETDAANYYTIFNLPGNERWYAASWGPDLRVIALDGEVLDGSCDTWQEQLDWLESELENSENYLWKIVAFHRPIVSSGGWDYGRLEDWGYLFTKYGVDVAFQAHIHWYDRSYPIDSDPPPGEVSSPEEGVVYIVSGGWGGPLSHGSPQPYTAYGPESRYHFTLTNVFENCMFYSQAIDQYGAVFDEFSIYKEFSVDISISPEEYHGLPGENFTFTITVSNTGENDDNYNLTADDDAGWGLELENEVLEIPAGENRTTTLTVIVPKDAEPGTKDNIIVTATSMADNTVSDNDGCIAHVIPPKAELSLVTLYKVGLDLDVYLDNGSKLVVKFYKYSDTFQAENVVWENVTPARVVLVENVLHPRRAERYPWGTVQVAKLVLTTDNTDDVISEIASFTVHQSDLMNRHTDILLAWAGCPSCQPAFRAEIIDILLQWASAPP